MNTSEQVKKEFNALVKQKKKKKKLLELTEDKENIIDFGTTYQQWYSRAYKLVESLAPERLGEFTSYYLVDPKRKGLDARSYVLQDYIMGIAASTDRISGLPFWDEGKLMCVRVMNQMQIIASLSSRIDSVIQDVTGHLFAELQDSELSAAVQLKKVNIRAAGALAGVVLERHLQQTAKNHKITIRKKSPTISDLNDPLKKAKVYDVPTWRKIQLLADIRNICCHQKDSEPTYKQVDELITGVNSVIKSVF